MPVGLLKYNTNNNNKLPRRWC